MISMLLTYFMKGMPEALERWKHREFESIKASSNGYTYDRYDPAYGLHYPVREDDE